MFEDFTTLYLLTRIIPVDHPIMLYAASMPLVPLYPSNGDMRCGVIRSCWTVSRCWIGWHVDTGLWEKLPLHIPQFDF